MIITAVVGLVVLMAAMLLGVKHFVGQDSTAAAMGENSIKQEEKGSELEYTSTILAVVTELTDDEIKAIDTESRQELTRPIDRTTKVADAYNRTIPLTSIKEGDIVEIVYQEDKDRTISINKSSQGWSKNSVSGAKVNTSASELELFGVVYTYDRNIMILHDGEKDAKIELITPYDIVTVQGIKDRVLSIRVEKAAGSIVVTDIPSRQGRIELDINTMIPLSELVEPINVIAGKHKIVVSIKGYENIVEEIDVAPGETYTLSLDRAKRSYTNVKVAISNVDVEAYNIKIDNKTYAKGEQISIPQGTYNVTITAENYKPWTKTVTFAKENYTLKATLQSNKIEETASPSTSPDSGTSGAPSKEETNNTEATSETKTIDIATDPSGAKVYINGVNRGTTPYKVTLPMGSYSVLLEKDGYEVYSTSIILDGSDDQTGFLYVLTQN